MNIVCVICSDLLVPSDDVFHTPCGHVFHHACLLQWIERSHTCPQCRQRTTESKIHRIYFNFSNNESILEDPVSLQTRIDSLNFQLKLKQKDVDDLKGENEKLGKQTSGLRHEVRKIENKIVSKDSVIFALNDQIKFFKQECSDMKNYKEENIQLKKELENLKCIRSLVDESVSKLDSIIMETSDTFKLKTYIAVLKREMMVTSDRCKEIRERYNNLRHQYSRVTGDNKALAEERVKRKKLEEQLILCESEKMSLEVKLHKMQQNELNCIDSDLSLKSLSNSNRQEKHNTVKKSNTVNDCMPKSKSASALNDTSGSSDNWIIVNVCKV
ncbi:hypothetical protein PUN28_003407 [Cardiocondyla obscurior]|uniref:RING-type domain-containing protein n=1 Tax=Cardiocondyla obscurior TaxID=286306 RepID=A0AAW2GJG7_9HYME